MIYGSGLQLLASTGVPGVALANGTQVIFAWTAPNDGQVHRVLVLSALGVTSALTGGQVRLHFTVPDGSTTANGTVISGGEGASAFNGNPVGVPVKAGTAVTLSQDTAATLGAATLWAELWGS